MKHFFKSIKIVLCIFSLFITSFTVWGSVLRHISFTPFKGRVALSFELDKPAQHRVFMLTHPSRIVVDFDNTTLGIPLRALPVDHHLVKNIRSGHPSPHILRIVFEVSDAVLCQRLPVRDSTPTFSLNLLTRQSPITSAPAPQVLTTVKPPLRVSMTNVKPIIVVIDPGHGGHDPGAIGQHRTLEKHVTLAIAKRLKTLIDQKNGMRAVLTRQGDTYVGLRQRLSIARRHNADLFIAIHADAFIHPGSAGASVFALSQRGATSEAARWLAEKENYSELGGVNLRGLKDASGLVRTVLIDLSQTATISASLHLGEHMLRNLSKTTTLHNRRVEQARFMVLKSPDIPSILIEMGFISNPREEYQLSNAHYQTQLANALFNGVQRYFEMYQPQRVTPIEPTPAGRHIVARGESLSRIAAKYHLPQQKIITANHLKSSQVNIGQLLIIPDSRA